MNSVQTTTGSSRTAVERTTQQQDRRSNELLVGFAGVAAPDFSRLLQETMPPAQKRSHMDETTSTRSDDNDPSKRSSRSGADERREPRFRSDRASGNRDTASVERRNDRSDHAAKELPADKAHGTEKELRQTPGDDAAASEPDGLPQDMKPTLSSESSAPVGSRPVATVQNVATPAAAALTPGVGVVKLDGIWRAVGVQGQQAPEAAPAPDPGQVKQQVINSLLKHMGLNNGKGDIRLHLEPAHLGKLDIQLTRVGERLEIHIRVESAMAESALREGADELGQLLLGRSTSWNEVKIHILATEKEDDEGAGEPQDRPEHGTPDDGDQRADHGDDQEGER